MRLRETWSDLTLKVCTDLRWQITIERTRVKAHARMARRDAGEIWSVQCHGVLPGGKDVAETHQDTLLPTYSYALGMCQDEKGMVVRTWIACLSPSPPSHPLRS